MTIKRNKGQRGHDHGDRAFKLPNRDYRVFYNITVFNNNFGARILRFLLVWAIVDPTKKMENVENVPNIHLYIFERWNITPTAFKVELKTLSSTAWLPPWKSDGTVVTRLYSNLVPMPYHLLRRIQYQLESLVATTLYDYKHRLLGLLAWTKKKGFLTCPPRKRHRDTRKGSPRRSRPHYPPRCRTATSL